MKFKPGDLIKTKYTFYCREEVYSSDRIGLVLSYFQDLNDEIYYDILFTGNKIIRLNEKDIKK